MTTLIDTPDYLVGDGYTEYQYYVPGHNDENVEIIDFRYNLIWEKIWMVSVPVSSIPIEERGDLEPLIRDKSGRFKTNFAWIECKENTNGAEPWLGIRYKP